MSTTEAHVDFNNNILSKRNPENLNTNYLTAQWMDVISGMETINMAAIDYFLNHSSETFLEVPIVRLKSELQRKIFIKLKRVPYQKLSRISKSRQLLRTFIEEVDEEYQKQIRIKNLSSPSSGYARESASNQGTRFLKRTPKMHIKAKSKKPKTIPKGEYIIEYIESMESHCAQPLYFVKWKDYPSNTNTWEPFANIRECLHLEVFLKRELKKFETTIDKILKSIRKEIEENDEVLTAADVNVKALDGFDVLAYQSDLVLLAQFWLSGSKSKVESGKIRDRIKKTILRKPLIMRRLQQLKDIAFWELAVNDIETNAKVTVENNVDLEVPDPKFNYIKSSVPGKGVQIIDNPPIGCKCKDGCAPSSACCSKLAGGRFAYNKYSRLQIQSGEAIYECNRLCKCGPDCLNRTIQRGRKNSICIFKTPNGCGWSLKTHNAICKGEFVFENVGEILLAKEANERGKQYDVLGRTYLFDLDYNTSAESVYTIDSAFYGNLSHFINHSCDPNLAVFPTWIDCLDINMPRLAFFAIKPIKAGEELSCDYIHRQHDSDLKYENLSKAEKISCRCGADNCRKVLF